MSPNKAFILAAGFGKRLRPHTNEVPKPLVKVASMPMIDQALERLQAVGVQSCVVNTHYKAEALEAHLQTRNDPHITISHEPELLDTGGGIKNAIHNFDAPFFVLSGDSVWKDVPGESALQILGEAWNPETMDILMLLQPISSMHLTQGIGDYYLDKDGRAVRSLDRAGNYMFTSIRINAPHIFDSAPDGAFSYLQLLDQAQTNGRLFGLVHHSDWHHISTPKDLDAVNKALE